MAPLKLSNPFRRADAAPSLKRRAAVLKSDLLNLTARPATPNPLPAPGSPEAIEAWRRACTEFDRLTALSEAEYAALRIGDGFALWTTDGVEAAQRGDLTRFSPRDIPAVRAKTAAELADLLVITARRDLRFAEARRQTGIRELYALAYPNGEDPAPEPDPQGDYALVIIAEHRAAYAAWEPHLDAIQVEKVNTDAYRAAEAAGELARLDEEEAFGNLIDTRATTLPGLVALARYLPEAVRLNGCSEPDEDAVRALRSMCNGVLKLAEGGTLAADLGIADASDPIHAAIAESYRAEAEMKAFGEDPTSTSRPNWILRERALSGAQSAAQDAVWRTTPTTKAGRLALVDYARFQTELYAGTRTDPNCPHYLFRDIMGAITAAFEADCAPADDDAWLNLRDASLGQLARLHDHIASLAFIASTACNAPMAWDGKRQNHNSIGYFLAAEHVRLDELAERVVAEIGARTPANNSERDSRLSVLIKRQMETEVAIRDSALMAEITAAWGNPAP